MAVKLVVMYPRPRDIEVFDKIYDEEHVPMAIAKLAGKTKMVGTRVLDSPQGNWRSQRTRFNAGFNCCVLSPCSTGGRCNQRTVTAPALLPFAA